MQDELEFKSKDSLKVYCGGDVVGRPGRRILARVVPLLKKIGIDLIIINGENSAGGTGITPQIVRKFFHYGVDVITTGDHFFKNQLIFECANEIERLLRPANFPKEVYGNEYCIIEKKGKKICVINLLGRTFINIGDCPFRKVEEIIKKLESNVDFFIVDFHAEATSEKIAMGWFLDGKASLVFGTHTHVQTADEKILPKGTAYITDIGMTGPMRSILGREIEPVIKRFILQIPFKFEIAKEDIEMNGIVVEIDLDTGKAINIERLNYKMNKDGDLI